MHFNYVIRKLLKPEEICNGPCIFILGEISRGGRWCLHIQEFILINSSSWIDFLLGLLLNCVWLGHGDWDITTKKEALDGSGGLCWSHSHGWCHQVMLHFSPLGPNSKAKGFLLSITSGLEWQEVFCEPRWRQSGPSKGSGAALTKTLLCPGEPCLWWYLGVRHISHIRKVYVHAA